MATAKAMFSSHGYDNTSTAELVREAGTSESQLIKHFGSKEGLLEAIFDEGWSKLDFIFVAARVSTNPAQRLRMVFELLTEGFQSDPAMLELMLLEGRRIRKGQSDIMMTQGYTKFVDLVEQIIREIISASGRPLEISAAAITSALLGMTESMARDQLLARRAGWKHFGTPEEQRKIFALWLRAITMEQSVPAKQ
jgi:AcrR family transcriptional regulator